MSEIRVGQRVRVEFDATVVDVGQEATMVDWSEGSLARKTLVPRRFCTVIVPPVKVGDTVTADNIGQLPPGSVLAHPLSPAWTLGVGGEWSRYGTSPADGSSFCTGSYVVLRIGGEA